MPWTSSRGTAGVPVKTITDFPSAPVTISVFQSTVVSGKDCEKADNPANRAADKSVMRRNNFMAVLFCVSDGTGFADNGNLYLSGIGHLVLDTLRDIGREAECIIVADLLSANYDAKLAASLDCI